MDGDLRRLRIMFAPDTKSEAREIPLNLHGMGGPAAKFPVVDQWCYTCLFSCFSVENVITLVRCLATSQSILLLSDNLEMLAPCAEVWMRSFCACCCLFLLIQVKAFSSNRASYRMASCLRLVRKQLTCWMCSVGLAIIAVSVPVLAHLHSILAM